MDTDAQDDANKANAAEAQDDWIFHALHARLSLVTRDFRPVLCWRDSLPANAERLSRK